MTPVPRAVVDPCVYIAAGRKPDGSTHAFLARGLDDGDYQIVWSQKLGYELQQTFEHPKQAQVIQPEWAEDLLADLDEQAELVNDPKLTNAEPLPHHRNDDYLVALAREEKVPLVTLDGKVLRNAPPDVEVMRPHKFLMEVERQKTSDLGQERTDNDDDGHGY